jgi:peptide/nickel transport system substrate-binding protein
MKKLRWQFIIILLTGLVVGVLLINQQQQQQQQQLLPSSAVVATPIPASGGIYTEGLIGSFNRLNPLLAPNNSADQDVNRLIFSSLIRFDSRGNPLPDLAESWGYSKDGTLYNFSLRKDIQWHDGKPVTTDDVIFTIDLIKDSKNYLPEDLQAFWKDIEIKRLSDQLLQFRLPEAFSPFLDYLTFGILPKHLLGTLSLDQIVNDAFNLKPIGSGPYRFDRFNVVDGKIVGVVLKAFDQYYTKKPYLDQVNFNYYPDAATAFAAYRAGSIQGISQITADILPEALAEPALSIYTARQPRLMMIYMNLNNPDVEFFKEAGFRRALLMALNRQSILDNVFYGQAVIADGPIFPGTWAYYDGIEHLAFDQSAAKNLLKDTGYGPGKDNPNLVNLKDEKPVAFQLLYPDDPTYQAVADSIKNYWAELGISVDLVAKPYDQIINENLAPRNYQAALVEINLTQTPDPDPYPFWDQAQKASGQNYAQWDNKAASEFLEQARVSIDQGERSRLYHNFQVLFTKEMPALPLFYPVYSFGIDNQVKGVQIGPLFTLSDRFSNITEWSLPVKKISIKTAFPSTTSSATQTP